MSKVYSRQNIAKLVYKLPSEPLNFRMCGHIADDENTLRGMLWRYVIEHKRYDVVDRDEDGDVRSILVHRITIPEFMEYLHC
jgi:hypothetical protein